MLKYIKDKGIEFIVVVILIGGVAYSSTTAWKNEEKLGAVGEDIRSIKKSMISLLLDEKPNKSTIAKELISDTSFLKGIDSFKSGEYKVAYKIWENAAQKGNRDAVYAIAVANEALEGKLSESNLPNIEKVEIQKLLKDAPKVIVKGGVYVLRKKKN